MSEIVSSNSPWSEAFHFIPKDEHMVMFLQNRLMGLPVPGIQGLTIKDVNVYEDLTPREIFAKSEFREGFQQGPIEPDKERYCITKLKRTTKGGTKFVRTTGGGTWKIQGSEKIKLGKVTALKRAFTYKPSKSGSCGPQVPDDCSWVMYEYSLVDQDIAICKVRKRSSKKRDRFEDDEEDMLRSGSTKFHSTRESDIDVDNAMYPCVSTGPPLNATVPNDGGFLMGPATEPEDSSNVWLDDFYADFSFDDKEMFTIAELFKDDCLSKKS